MLYNNLVDSEGQLYLTNKHRQINVGKALANLNCQRQRPMLPNEVRLKILSLLTVIDLINMQGFSKVSFIFALTSMMTCGYP